MGELYIAKCYSCGYKTDALHFGGGMSDFMTYDGEPVFNSNTNEVEVANGKNRDAIVRENPNFRFYYNDESLQKNHQELTFNFGGEIGTKILNDVKLHFCPKCKEFGLDFLWYGMWD